MKFRLKALVHGWNVDSSSEFLIPIGGKTYKFLIEPSESNQHDWSASLVVIGDFEITTGARPVFDKVIMGYGPSDRRPAKSVDDLVIADYLYPCIEYYPKAFANFHTSVVEELEAIADKVIGIINWTTKSGTSKKSVSALEIQSFDVATSEWRNLPRPKNNLLSATMTQEIILDIGSEFSDAKEQELQHIISNYSEPVAHLMLKEAKNISAPSSNGSAIVMALSAAEVAVKDVIYKRAPNATWLLDNLNSPPIVKILREYFPILFPDTELFYRIEKLQEGLLYDLQNAVLIRNRIVHHGEHPNKLSEKCRKIITTVERLVWGCDYLNGHEWAFKYAKKR